MNWFFKAAYAISFVLIISSQAIAQNAQSFRSEELSVPASVKLYGTLLVPPKGSTVVLFISGSGPTDRNGNSGLLSTDCTKLLAEDLALKGIASLRYDKRGAGQSKDPLMKEQDVLFDTLIYDAMRWIRLLREDKRFKRIIVAGHSEGSLVGMVAAHRQKADAFISLAGAGRTIDVVIREQIVKNPFNTSEVLQHVDSAFNKLKNGKLAENIPPYLMSLFRPSVQPFIISWLKYNPSEEIRRLKIPVLIIQGSTDIQVSILDSEILRDSSPKATYKVIEGMNHIFRDAPTDQQLNVATYYKPQLPISSTLTPTIIDFIKAFKL